MGNSHTNDSRKEVNGGIFIQIQKTNFVSNEMIEGKLHINLEEPFKGHILVIQLDGVEETRFDYLQIKNEKKENKKIKELKTFLSLPMPIYDFATIDQSDGFVLMPGQWSIPFSIKIADKLPSSIKYFKSQGNNCSISYSLSAFILPNNSDCLPIQGHQDIFVSQKLINLTHTVAQQSIENAPLFSCCLSTGSYKLNCQLNEPSYAPTESICLEMECNLSSFRKKMDMIRIELIGMIMMAGDNNFIQYKEQINVLTQEVPINRNDPKTCADIIVPSTICCTAKGTNIDIQYKLVITPVLNLSCLKGNDSLVLPLIILPKKKLETGQEYPKLISVQTPSNWNPILLKQEEYKELQTLTLQQLNVQFYGSSNLIDYKKNEDEIEDLNKPIMNNPAKK